MNTTQSQAFEKTLSDLREGKRAIVSEEFLDWAVGEDIATCRNRHRLGIQNKYIAWIRPEACPNDITVDPSGNCWGSIDGKCIPDLKWSKGICNVDFGDSLEQIPGYVAFPFNIHKNPSGWFVVSHQPTGRAIREFERLKTAKDYAAALAEGLDWGFTDGMLPEECRRRWRDLKHQPRFF